MAGRSNALTPISISTTISSAYNTAYPVTVFRGSPLVYLVQVQDPAVYAAALAEMNDALGNPGVLRLVAMRSGSRAVTHAVLNGGDDFPSVNEYMDKLYASDAFRTFASKVGDIRSVVHIESYRKVGAWGY